MQFTLAPQFTQLQEKYERTGVSASSFPVSLENMAHHRLLTGHSTSCRGTKA